jgi:hypothetical protein
MMSDTKDSVIGLASKIAKLLARLPARDPDIDRHADRAIGNACRLPACLRFSVPS